MRILYANEFDLKGEYHRIGGIAETILSEIPALKKTGAKISTIHSLSEKIHPWYEPVDSRKKRREEFAPKLIRKIRSFKPDYIFFHYVNYQTVTTIPLLIDYRRKENLSFRIIVFLHDCMVPFSTDKVDGKNYSHYWSKADTIICVSRYLKNLIIEKTGITPIKVLYPSVNSAFLKERRRTNHEKNVKNVSYIARFHPDKGIDLAGELAKRLETNPEFKFTFVGRLDDEFSRNSVKKLKQLSNLKIVDYTRNKSSIRQFLLKTDVLINPSRREAAGTTLLEALCCGAVIIASDVEGVKDNISRLGLIEGYDFMLVNNSVDEYEKALKKTEKHEVNFDVNQLNSLTRAEKLVKILIDSKK